MQNATPLTRKKEKKRGWKRDATIHKILISFALQVLIYTKLTNFISIRITKVFHEVGGVNYPLYAEDDALSNFTNI